jgi:hypothetical protein
LGGTNVQHAAVDERTERIPQRFEQPLLAAAVLTIPPDQDEFYER